MPEPFPISCVCKSLYSDRKDSISKKICHLGCVNFDMRNASDKEECHFFLHVSKRKDSGAGSKVSSAIVALVGWLRDGYVMLSCHPAMDPDGILMFGDGSVLKDNVDRPSTPLKVQNLTSFKSNDTSSITPEDKCKAWLRKSESRKTHSSAPKKPRLKFRKTVFHDKYINKSKTMLFKPKTISKQHLDEHNSNSQKMGDVNSEVSNGNPPEIPLASNENFLESEMPVNIVQQQYKEEEFLDCGDEGDESEMQSCTEELDEPGTEEKFWDVISQDQPTVFETTPSTLNSCGIAVIDHLEQRFLDCIPSRVTSDKSQNLQLKIDSPESGLKKESEIQTPSGLSDSQPVLNEDRNEHLLSSVSSVPESKMLPYSNSKSSVANQEEPQVASVVLSPIIGEFGYLFHSSLKKCEPHTDLSTKDYLLASTSEQDRNRNVAKINPKSETLSKIETFKIPFIEKHKSASTRKARNTLHPKKPFKNSDDPMIKVKHPTLCGHLGAPQSSVTHSGSLRTSQKSSISTLAKSTPIDSIKNTDDSSNAVSKSNVAEQTPHKEDISKQQDTQTLAIKSDVKSCSEEISCPKLSETKNVQQGIGHETEQASELSLKNSTNTNCFRDGNLSTVKQSDSESINDRSSLGQQGKNEDRKPNRIVEMYNKSKQNNVLNSVPGTSKTAADQLALQTSRETSRIQKLCDRNVRRKLQSKTREPLSPSAALHWSNRVRTLFQKLSVEAHVKKKESVGFKLLPRH